MMKGIDCVMETQEQQTVSETEQMKRAYNRAGLGTLAMYGILQEAASLILVIGVVLITMIKLMPHLRSWNGSESLSSYIQMLQESGTMGWILGIYVLGMIVGMIAGILIMRRICRRIVPIEKHTLSFGSFLKIVIFAYGLWGIGILLGSFPGYLGAEEESFLDQMLKGLGFEAVPLYLYTVIGAPVFEELALRKVLLDRLHPYGEGFAMAASGLLFGLIHGNSMQFFLAFLLGMLFAMIYLRTGRIIYTMLLHAIINLTATVPEIVKLFGPNIDDIWNFVILGLGVIGCVAMLLRRNDPILHPEKSLVPDAAKAAWKNAGMLIARIAGLVLIVFNDIVVMAMSLLLSEDAIVLLRLIPVTLTILTVVLLPRWTRRFEGSAAEAEPEGAELKNA